MRELTLLELELVAGGNDTLNGKPITDLPGPTVTPPPDPGPIGPIGPIGTGGDGGFGDGGQGGGGGSGGSGGDGSVDHSAALHKIGDMVGIDLSHLGGHSEIFNALMQNLTDNNWSVQFRAGGSQTIYDPAHLNTGTIYLDNRYVGDERAILEQLTHEAVHAADTPQLFANSSNLNGYLDYNLGREGLAELRSMQVADQIKAATGTDIGFTATAATRSMYQATYDHYVSDPGHYTFYNAMHDMANIYGNYEHTGNGESYHDYYVNEYYRNGGH